MFHVQHRIGSFKYFLVAVECVVHSTKRSLINELGAPGHNLRKRSSSPFALNKEKKCQEFKRHSPVKERLFWVNCASSQHLHTLTLLQHSISCDWELSHKMRNSPQLDRGQEEKNLSFIDKRIYFGGSFSLTRSSWMKCNFNCYSQQQCLIKGPADGDGDVDSRGHRETKAAARNECELSSSSMHWMDGD